MSRKVTDSMLEAIRARRNRTMGNTTVSCSEKQVEVRLHGNLIAVLSLEIAKGAPEPNGRVTAVAVTLAGWNGPTTRDRVNAILATYVNGRPAFTQKAFKSIFVAAPFVDGKAWRYNLDDSTWVTFASRDALPTFSGDRPAFTL